MTPSVPAVARARRTSSRWAALGAGIVAGLASAGLIAAWLWPSARVLPTLNLALDWPDDVEWVGASGTGVALSPDGTHVAYIARRNQESARLHVRDLRTGETRVLPSADVALNPFFSPDSTQVGFIAGGKLWRAPVSGGSPFEIGSIDTSDRGVAWSHRRSRVIRVEAPESHGSRRAAGGARRSPQSIVRRAKWPTVSRARAGGTWPAVHYFQGAVDGCPRRHCRPFDENTPHPDQSDQPFGGSCTDRAPAVPASQRAHGRAIRCVPPRCDGAVGSVAERDPSTTTEARVTSALRVARVCLTCPTPPSGLRSILVWVDR